MHKWQPKKYSFACVLISLTSLACMDKRQKKCCLRARVVSLINTSTKEYFLGCHLCIRSMKIKHNNAELLRGKEPAACENRRLRKEWSPVGFWPSIEATEKFANYYLQSFQVIQYVKKIEYLLVCGIITTIYQYWKLNNSILLSTVVRVFSPWHQEQPCYQASNLPPQ